MVWYCIHSFRISKREKTTSHAVVVAIISTVRAFYLCGSPPLYFALALTTGIALTSLEGQQPEFFFNITVSWFNGDEKRGKKEGRKEGKNRIRYPQRRSRW